MPTATLNLLGAALCFAALLLVPFLFGEAPEGGWLERIYAFVLVNGLAVANLCLAGGTWVACRARSQRAMRVCRALGAAVFFAGVACVIYLIEQFTVARI